MRVTKRREKGGNAMKQTKRRILAWLMTVVLVLSVVTVLTPAKEAEAAAATAVLCHLLEEALRLARIILRIHV